MPDPEVEMNMIYERLQPHMRDAFTRVLQWHVDSQAEVDKKAWDGLWEYLKEELLRLQMEALEYKALYESATERCDELKLEVYELKQQLEDKI